MAISAAAIIRRSRSLVLSFDEERLVVCDFLRGRTTCVDEVDLALLACAQSWIEVPALYRLLQPRYCPCCIAAELTRLMDAGVILTLGTQEAAQDEGYAIKWAWGAMAGYFHFGIKDPYYMTPAETNTWLSNAVVTKPLVPLYTTNDGIPNIVRLPPPSLDREIFAVMKRRRSYRGFDPSADRPVKLNQLSDCLYSGAGIVGFIETPMSELGLLPLKMTPSAGGRNPYEVYVYACNVEGLRVGVYHYSAVDNTLGLIRDKDLPSVGDVLAVQPWFDNAAALILFVANFERTMWKYPHPTGFRVVLLEAGHIAQNILLAATANGLASAPTSAISDTLAENLLGLDRVTQGVVYSVAIGASSDTPTEADVVRVIPNHRGVASV